MNGISLVMVIWNATADVTAGVWPRQSANNDFGCDRQRAARGSASRTHTLLVSFTRSHAKPHLSLVFPHSWIIFLAAIAYLPNDTASPSWLYVRTLRSIAKRLI
jgi:hypothetical protein